MPPRPDHLLNVLQNGGGHASYCTTSVLGGTGRKSFPCRMRRREGDVAPKVSGDSNPGHLGTGLPSDVIPTKYISLLEPALTHHEPHLIGLLEVLDVVPHNKGDYPLSG